MRDNDRVTRLRLDEPKKAVARTMPCSARGCRDAASWGLRWNNPKLHTPERRKTWLACDEHLASLGDFLTARGFLRETVPLAELTPTDMS